MSYLRLLRHVLLWSVVWYYNYRGGGQSRFAAFFGCLHYAANALDHRRRDAHMVNPVGMRRDRLPRWVTARI